MQTTGCENNEVHEERQIKRDRKSEFVCQF